MLPLLKYKVASSQCSSHSFRGKGGGMRFGLLNHNLATNAAEEDTFK